MALGDYGDTLQDWLDNPQAAWTAVWARVNVAADRVQVRQQKIPTIEANLGAAQQRVAALPPGPSRDQQAALVSQAQNELASLKAESSSLTGQVLEAISNLRAMQARITSGTFSGLGAFGALGQFEVLTVAIVVGFVAVSVAAIAWSTKFDSKAGLFDQAMKAGMTAEQAAAYAAGGGNPLGKNPLGLNFDLTPVVLVVLAVVFLPQIVGQVKRARAAA